MIFLKLSDSCQFTIIIEDFNLLDLSIFDDHKLSDSY